MGARALLDNPNVPRPPSKRTYEPAKIDLEVLKAARVVAAHRGTSLAEYLSEILLPIVKEHLQGVARDITDDGAPRRRKPSSD